MKFVSVLLYVVAPLLVLLYVLTLRSLSASVLGGTARSPTSSVGVDERETGVTALQTALETALSTIEWQRARLDALSVRNAPQTGGELGGSRHCGGEAPPTPPFIYNEELSEEEARLLYSHQCTETHDSHASATNGAAHSACARGPLLIVIPFIESQLDLLLTQIDEWRQFPPCGDSTDASSNNDTDLLYDFHRSLAPAMRDELERQVSVAGARRCFRRILFHSHELSAEQDHYGEGTLRMFYSHYANATRYAALRADYAHLFVMEPDVHVVRRDWLSALRAEREAARLLGVWQLGSLIRTPRFLERGWGRDTSLSGNSLYALRDACFRNFVLRVRHFNAESTDRPFDVALNAFRNEERRFHEYQHVAHRFVYSDLLQNWGDGHTRFSASHVRSLSPRTAFVHSKMRVDEERPNEARVRRIAADVLRRGKRGGARHTIT